MFGVNEIDGPLDEQIPRGATGVTGLSRCSTLYRRPVGFLPRDRSQVGGSWKQGESRLE